MRLHAISMSIVATLALGLMVAASAKVVYGDDACKQARHVHIASFNVYKLGGIEKRYTSLKEDPEKVPGGTIPQRIRNAASVLAVGNFDLVALQEVYAGKPGLAAVADLVKVLNDEHGITYEFLLSEGVGVGLIPEAMGFLYRRPCVHPKTVNDSSSESITIEINGRYAGDRYAPRDFVQTYWKAGHFDFTVISVHLAYEKRDKRRAGYEKVREIFFDWPADRTNGDPDVIVLGDFNRHGKDTGNGPKAVKALLYDPEQFRVPNVTFFDPEFSKLPEVKDEAIEGKGVPNDDPQLLSTTVADNKFAYDMIMFASEAGDRFPAKLHEGVYGRDFGIIHFDHPGGVGFQAGADRLDHECLKKMYSDHRPVWIRFRTE